MTGTHYIVHLQGKAVREPASAQVVEEIETTLGVRLPEDYKSFFRYTNGYEGPIGEDNYVSLARIEGIAKGQRDYEVSENAPGFLMIGSNGGGEMYGYDMRSTPWKICMIPFVPMNWNDAIFVGDSFESFLQNLAFSNSLYSSSET